MGQHGQRPGECSRRGGAGVSAKGNGPPGSLCGSVRTAPEASWWLVCCLLGSSRLPLPGVALHSAGNFPLRTHELMG